MNILLLGGTGAMGEHLTKILSSQKENNIFVTTRTRRISKTQNVTFLTGNAHELTFLDSILTKEKWDTIVDFMVYNTDEFYYRSNKLLTSCKQYIFISSSRVYANSKEPITEKSPRLLDICKDNEYLATDEYALSKARQEDILFNNKHKNWTIIRPYITYSEKRLQLGVLEKEIWLYSALKCGILVFSKDIAQHITTLTYGYDVARGIFAIIGKKEAFGEVFHITGNNNIKWQKIYEIFKETLSSSGIQFQTDLKEETYRLKGNGKYQVIYDRYFDRIFDNSKIGQFIDITSFIKPEEGVRNCLQSFLENPQFSSINVREIIYQIEGTKGRIHLSSLKGLKNKIIYILIKLHLR